MVAEGVDRLGIMPAESATSAPWSIENDRLCPFIFAQTMA